MEESYKDILEKFNNSRKDEYLCDVTLVVEEKKFPCHRLVLATRCSYFHAMFGKNFKEKDSNEIILKGLSNSEFENVLHYLYVNEVNIDRDNVKNLLFASDMLGIEKLQESCLKFMEEANGLNNLVELYIYADLHDNAKLVDKLKRFICEKFSDICSHNSESSNSVVHLNYDRLKLILESNDLTVEKEETVLDGLLKWIKFDKENRLKHMDELLSLIKIPSLSSSYMIDLLLNDPIIRSEKKYQDMIVKGSHSSFYRSYKKPKQELRENVSGIILFSRSGDDIVLEMLEEDQKLVQNFDKLLSLRTSYLRSVLLAKNTLFVLWIVEEEEMKFQKINLDTRERVNLNPPPVFSKTYSLQTDGSRIYLYYRNNLKNMFFAYNVLLNDWIGIPDFPTHYDQIMDSCFKVHGNFMCVIGGLLSNNETKNVYFFDLIGKYWSALPPMNKPRHRASACFAHNNLYVSGGSSSSMEVPFEQFNFITRKWRMLNSNSKRRLPSDIFGHSMLYRNNKLIMIGGLSKISPYQSTINYIDVCKLVFEDFVPPYARNSYTSMSQNSLEKIWTSVEINRKHIEEAILFDG